ncbi:uncharacterized protein PRCAT00002477001 [Priceomyces carsonii]|uniref:uncharacterized protein n=1 Tax=Priceomyces carsonii TaxID=28549 RepID=UPI002EDB4A20|nr:unnamed protein product [Priceomyces carsonii]
MNMSDIEFDRDLCVDDFSTNLDATPCFSFDNSLLLPPNLMTISDIESEQQLSAEEYDEEYTEEYAKELAEKVNTSLAGTFFDNILNLPTKLMTISNFEFRLVKFFDVYCINLFSFGADKYVDTIWRRHVPHYFCRSSLIRLAVFLFSCLNLWPIYEYQKFGQDSSNDDDIYLRTTMYFANAVREKNSAINRLMSLTEDEASSLEGVDLAAELMFTSTLIFSFLGIHSHKLLPLISFNEGPKNDFLSVCEGLVNIREVCMLRSGGQVQRYFWTARRIRSLKCKSIPITALLNEQLQEYFDDEIVDAALSLKRECYRELITILQQLLRTGSKHNYPIPVFIWVLVIDNTLFKYIRSKDFFALRLLYVYACLCQISRFLLNLLQNMWIDYIHWFRDYNIKLFGDWKYAFDKGFFNLVKSEFLIDVGKCAIYDTLDPGAYADFSEHLISEVMNKFPTTC